MPGAGSPPLFVSSECLVCLECANYLPFLPLLTNHHSINFLFIIIKTVNSSSLHHNHRCDRYMPHPSVTILLRCVDNIQCTGMMIVWYTEIICWENCGLTCRPWCWGGLRASHRNFRWDHVGADISQWEFVYSMQAPLSPFITLLAEQSAWSSEAGWRGHYCAFGVTWCQEYTFWHLSCLRA